MTKARKNTAVSASFCCSVCGQEASLVTFVPAGQPDPRLTPETPDMPQGISMLGSDQARLSIHGGPVSYTIGVSGNKVELVKAALLARSAAQLYALDYQYAPFWCRECKHCYCREHYPSYAAYDDGHFDCYYGTCPKGHKRMLSD